MSISMACPQCARRLNVPETWAGKTIRCKGCGGVLRAPANEAIQAAAPAPAAAAEEEEDEEDEEVTPPRRKRRGPLLGLLVGLGVLLIGGGAAALLLLRSGQTRIKESRSSARPADRAYRNALDAFSASDFDLAIAQCNEAILDDRCFNAAYRLRGDCLRLGERA